MQKALVLTLLDIPSHDTLLCVQVKTLQVELLWFPHVALRNAGGLWGKFRNRGNST